MYGDSQSRKQNTEYYNFALIFLSFCIKNQGGGGDDYRHPKLTRILGGLYIE